MALKPPFLKFKKGCSQANLLADFIVCYSGFGAEEILEFEEFLKEIGKTWNGEMKEFREIGMDEMVVDGF